MLDFRPNQTEKDRNRQISAILLQAKCLKMCHFLSVCLQILTESKNMIPKFVFLKNTIWVSKNAESCTDFKIVDQGLKECSYKKLCQISEQILRFSRFWAFPTLLSAITVLK